MCLGRFEGKIVLVTASTEGIGFAIAERIASEGGEVIISSRKEKKITEAVNQLKAKNYKVVGFACNVSKQEDRDNLFKFIQEKYGRLDVLIPNAAASLHFGPSLDTPEKAYDKMFETNVKAVFMMVKEYMPLLLKSDKKPNICITSSYTAYDNSTMIGIYGVTKTSLLGLTKMLAKELLFDEIRVNCVCPGLIRTKFAGALLKDEKLALSSTGA